jgi:hypothetical protein
MRPRLDCSALELNLFPSGQPADPSNFCRGGAGQKYMCFDLFRNLFNLRHNRLGCWCKRRTVDCIFSYLG